MSAEIKVTGFVQRVQPRDVGGKPLTVVDVKSGRKVRKNGTEAWENDFYRCEFWGDSAATVSHLNERDRVTISGALVPSIYQPDGKAPRFDLVVKFAALESDERQQATKTGGARLEPLHELSPYVPPTSDDEIPF